MISFICKALVDTILIAGSLGGITTFDSLPDDWKINTGVEMKKSYIYVWKESKYDSIYNGHDIKLDLKYVSMNETVREKEDINIQKIVIKYPFKTSLITSEYGFTGLWKQYKDFVPCLHIGHYINYKNILKLSFENNINKDVELESMKAILSGFIKVSKKYNIYLKPLIKFIIVGDKKLGMLDLELGIRIPIYYE